MDLEILQKVTLELNELLTGGFVNKIHQPLPREIVLRMRIRGTGEKMLMLSADPKLGRVHLTDLRMPNPPSPPRFCAFLRAHFQGARIVEIRAATDDRVVTINAVRGRGTECVQRALVLELLGRDSNILVVDRATNKIMDCLHRIPQKKTGNRIVLPQIEYFPPPKRIVHPDSSSTTSHIERTLPGNSKGSDIKNQLALYAVSSEGTGVVKTNYAADCFFRPLVESGILEALRKEIARPLKSRIRSLERRMEKIEADDNRLNMMAERQQEGELLKADLKAIVKGMDKIMVEDWNTGTLRTIALNPALDPVANMNRIFAKAAKGKRGAKIAQQRLLETSDEKRALEDLLYFVEEATTVIDLETLSGESASATLKSQRPVAGRKLQKNLPGSTMFTEFKTSSGKRVLIGKSGKGNDFLLRAQAHPGDLWFHAKGFAGAHVILFQRTSAPVTNEEIQFAADLALHFSRVRGAGKGEVMFADVKDVQRIAGSVPGRVSVRRYKTIVAKARNGS